MIARLLPCLLRALFITGITAIPLISVRAAEDEVVVISPHWEGIKDETSRAFSAWHQKTYGRPAVIRWREVSGGTSKIIQFLRAEYLHGSSAGVDVLYGGGVDPFVELKRNGLLTPYNPPAAILAQIPPQLNGMEMMDPDHNWFGACLSGFGILTNERARQAVDLPQVQTWADLTDPRMAGWISGIDPRASGSVLTIYEIILQSYGWDKGWSILTEMSGNVRSFLSSAAASATEVGLGDAAYGISIDVYGQAETAYYGAKNVRFVLPEGRTAITPDAIAILKNPPHPEMAQHFLEFVLSREGQLLWMAPKGSPGGATRHIINRMSVWPSLYDELAGSTPIATNPFKAHSDFVYSSKLGSSRRSILSVLIAAWMIDSHDDLVRAWKALNSEAAQKLPPERRQELLTELVAPPCSEDELLRLAANDWKDPVKRTALANQWQNDAQARYHRILNQIESDR